MKRVLTYQKDLATVTVEELSPLLELFVWEARKISGEEYHVNSLVGCIDAIFREINKHRKEQKLDTWCYHGKVMTSGFEGEQKIG